MSNDSITLALDGEVQIKDFASAMDGFRKLIAALTRAVGGRQSVEWIITNLDAGSATVTARGESRSLETVEHIAQGYLTVGRALRERERVPYSSRVSNPADKLINLLDGRISSIRFETVEADVIIRSEAASEYVSAPALVTAYGAIEGVVQALSMRRGLRFTLYDTIFDKAVSCYLKEGRESIMRDAWGRRAIVEGTVARDSDTVRAVSVRQVSAVEIMRDPEPGSYRHARAISPRRPDDGLLPEDRIRRLRDA